MTRATAYLGSFLFALAACSAGQPVEPAAPTPPPIAGAEPSAYVIGPGDRLQISVYGEPELSKEYAVSSEGDVFLPLAGRVRAAGLSVAALQEELVRRFAEYLVRPQVSVAVQQFRQRFTVLGEVQKPGSYPLEKRTTVLEAISIAGGLTPKAAPNRTRVMRTRDGAETTIEVPVGDIMSGREQSRDIPVEPDDKIVVPESFF